MIQQILEPFDWVLQMPIEDQCRYSIGLSFVGFCIAAVLREMCKDKHIRLAARALGAAAFFAVAAFAVHATKLVDRLEDVVASKQQRASEIASETAVTLTTKRGYKITIGDNHGVRRIGDESRERTGQLRPGDTQRAGSLSRLSEDTVGNHSSNGSGDDGVVAAARMLKQSGWWCDEGDAGSFQLPGKVEGEDF